VLYGNGFNDKIKKRITIKEMLVQKIFFEEHSRSCSHGDFMKNTVFLDVIPCSLVQV
jgi:hypothetical protein